MTVMQIENAATSSDPGLAGRVGHKSRRDKTRIPLSYGSIGSLLAVAEFSMIALFGVLISVSYTLVEAHDVERMKNFAGFGLACGLLYVLAMQSQHLYKSSFILNPTRSTQSVLLTWVMVFGFWIVVAFFAKASVDVSRGAAICFFLVGGLALPLSRIAAQRSLRYLVSRHRLGGLMRVVLLGDINQLLARDISGRLNRFGYTVVKQFSVDPVEHNGVLVYTDIAKSVEGIRRFVSENPVDEVFLVFGNGDQRTIEVVANHLKVIPIPVRLLFDQTLSDLMSRPIADLGVAKAVRLQIGPLTRMQQIVKRSFDICAAAAGLFALAPLLAFVAVAIKLDSQGPILFRQRRAGFGGRVFKIYKFRSMTTMDDGAVVTQATRSDKRVTRVGRFLRKTSIDELPQLLNVLKGDMSLVGPRPHALSHDSQYEKLIATYALRSHMKPGITGLAQTNGCRGETSSLSMMQERVKHDLFYIGHWSLMLDITIIARTVLQAMWPKDVY